MRLNYGKTFLLGFGFFAASLMWATYNAFVPLFLANKFNLPIPLIGFFMTLDNIAALFIQPPVGAWSDRIRSPIGRRMPFIVLGAPIAAAAFSLIPVASVLPLFAACTISMMLFMALWRTPVVALMPDITPSKFRSQANGVINLMGGLGTIIATLGGGSLYEMNPAYPFWLGAVLAVLAVILLFFVIKEPKEYEATTQEKPDLLKAAVSVVKDKEKSALRILLAIFCWFVAYNGIEAFFTLYATNHLGLEGGPAAKLVGHLSLIFVLFALPAGYIGAKFGRRRTIMTGIVLMGSLMLSMWVLPKELLNIPVAKVFGLGQIYTISFILMFAGGSWALININSLPMVVDMTDDLHIGTFTGLYYLFSTLAAIAGPNINSWIIALWGNNYGMLMIIGPVFMALAFVMMIGVRKGEAKTKQIEQPEPVPQIAG
jgi:maltose/moltooligosaccharide transporter